MITLTGQYYDGRQPVPTPATMDFSGKEALLTAGQISERYCTDDLMVSPSISTSDRFITLPNGAQFKCEDHILLAKLPQESKSEGVIAWLEEHSGMTAAALMITVCLLIAAYFYVLPVAAEHVAARIPVETEHALGQQALVWLDNRGLLKPTALPVGRRNDIAAGFGRLINDLPLKNYYRLEFRSAPAIGPNAFALPGGTIVITDEMIAMAQSKSEVLAVLAHEIGHAELRHTMQSALKGSAVAVLAAAVTSDAASLSAAVAGLPALLAEAKYSRQFEAAADEYGFKLLKRKGYSPAAFAAIMERLSKKNENEAGEKMFKYISSHPVTADRIERARAAAR